MLQARRLNRDGLPYGGIFNLLSLTPNGLIQLAMGIPSDFGLPVTQPGTLGIDNFVNLESNLLELHQRMQAESGSSSSEVPWWVTNPDQDEPFPEDEDDFDPEYADD
jgi:hypothetical protein